MKNVALGQVHRRAKGSGMSLCGLVLSQVDYLRKLPECGFCRTYAGMKAIQYQSPHQWRNPNPTERQRKLLAKSPMLGL